MNLIKIGELEVEPIFDPKKESGYREWKDKKDDLERASDLVLLTMSDGKRQFRTERNFLGGVCDCCTDQQSTHPVKFEFFKNI